MGTDYTKAERDTIGRAWDWLHEIAKQTEWGMSADLDEALRLERRERSSIHVAKALIVESAVQRSDDGAEALYSLARGCRVGAMVGARLRGRWPEKWAEILPKLQAAIDAHNASIARMLDSLKGK